MKIKFNTDLLVNIIIIGYITLVALEWWSLSYRITTAVHKFGDGEGDASYTWVNNDLKQIDPPVSDSLPHYRYKALKDSLQQVRDLKNGEGFGLLGGSVQFVYVAGTYAGMYCDTCSLKTRKIAGEEPGIKQYYILLPGWKLPISHFGWHDKDSVTFYADHGQSYIRKTILDKEVKNKNGSISGQIHAEDIPVKFKYNRLKNCLMIPVSERVKNRSDYILGSLGIALILYFLYLVSAFLKFILDLSKGLSFTDKNIRRLKLIAFSLLAYLPFMLLLNLLMRFIFRSYFTEDVVINPEIWSGWWKTVGVGIVFLLLFKAFKQGKILKNEHDFTV